MEVSEQKDQQIYITFCLGKVIHFHGVVGWRVEKVHRDGVRAKDCS